MHTEKQMHYDIIIIGAGLVGLTFAGLLANTGMRIAVIENGPAIQPENETRYDLRVCAITPASEKIFRQLNAWGGMRINRISPFRKMHVWDESGKGAIDFNSADIGEPYLGHIIENSIIRAALLTTLSHLPEIKFFYQTKLSHIHQHEKFIEVNSEDNRKFYGTLCVGTDGAQSWLRQQEQFPLESKNYYHTAIVTTIKTEKPHQQTARQRFLKDGVLAFLPLADPHSCSIVWSTLPAIAEELCAMNESDFNTHLAKTFDFVLGKTTCLDQRLHFPLVMQHAKTYVKPRIALLGDAAHTIHPLAGQGVNLGLADAASLAEILLAANLKNCDLGDLALLKRYQRARRGANLLMISLMDSFKNLFGNNWLPIVQARNFGLSLTNHLQPVKCWLMQEAMGLK